MEDKGIVDCGDFKGFISQLFNSPPKPPGTIRIDITDGDDSMTSKQFTSRLLGQILTHGLVHKFGEDVKLSELSSSDILLMKQYIQSLGFDVWVNEEIQNHTNNKQDEPFILPYCIKIKDDDKYQTVMFSILNLLNK